MVSGYVTHECVGRLFQLTLSRRAFATRSLAEILICNPHFDPPPRAALPSSIRGVQASVGRPEFDRKRDVPPVTG